MPGNCIDECARQIAIFNQKGVGTVFAYAMRSRTVLSQFQATVGRGVKDNRTAVQPRYFYYGFLSTSLRNTHCD